MNYARNTLLCLLAATLAGCVSAQEYQNLKIERDELRQDSLIQKQMLDAAEKNHAKIVSRLEGQIAERNERLAQELAKVKELQERIGKLEKEHAENSELAMKAARQTLALIEEKKSLNDTILKLNGTIATLEDQIKDLRIRLAELSAEKAPTHFEAKEQDLPGSN